MLGRRKVAKHFRLTITEEALSFVRDAVAIAREAALDGFYVLRTSVPAETLDAATTVLAYKSLAHVERAFRSLKSIDLDIRPVHHRRAGRVRAHIFLCMLAYYLAWHMRRELAPLLFEDHQRPAAAVSRTSPVAAVEVSPAARAKARSRKTDDGEPVHSFRTLFTDLATLTRNTMRLGETLSFMRAAHPAAATRLRSPRHRPRAVGRAHPFTFAGRPPPPAFGIITRRTGAGRYVFAISSFLMPASRRYHDPGRRPLAPPSKPALGPQPPCSMGLPRLPASPFQRAVPTTPANRDGCSCRLLPRPARPSPNLRRVGIRDFTFKACSGRLPCQAGCRLPDQTDNCLGGTSSTADTRRPGAVRVAQASQAQTS